MTSPAPELQPELRAELNDTRAALVQLEIDLAEAQHQLETARAELEELQAELGDALGELETARAELDTTTAQLQQARRAARWEGKRQRIRMLTAGR